MDDLDVKTWVEAARSYLRLRRRYWRCFLGMPALFVVVGLPIFAFEDELNPTVHGILALLFGIAWCVCWVGCVVTWFRADRPSVSAMRKTVRHVVVE